jgi:hypothetical protein
MRNFIISICLTDNLECVHLPIADAIAVVDDPLWQPQSTVFARVVFGPGTQTLNDHIGDHSDGLETVSNQDVETSFNTHLGILLLGPHRSEERAEMTINASDDSSQ